MIHYKDSSPLTDYEKAAGAVNTECGYKSVTCMPLIQALYESGAIDWKATCEMIAYVITEPFKPR